MGHRKCDIMTGASRCNRSIVQISKETSWSKQLDGPDTPRTFDSADIVRLTVRLSDLAIIPLRKFRVVVLCATYALQ